MFCLPDLPSVESDDICSRAAGIIYKVHIASTCGSVSILCLCIELKIAAMDRTDSKIQ